MWLDSAAITLAGHAICRRSDGRCWLRGWTFPRQLSLVPALLSEVLPPDVVLVQTSAPSGGTVSLLGLIRHMTEVERGWFRRRDRGT